MALKVMNDRDNRLNVLRSELEHSFNLRRASAIPSEQHSLDTCFQRGINAFHDAIEYGSVVREFERVRPFAESAFINFRRLIDERYFENTNDSAEQVAFEKCVTYFGFSVARALLDQSERPEVLLQMETSINAIENALTPERIARVVPSEDTGSVADEWAQYVIRLLGLHVLSRLWGANCAPDAVKQVVNTVSTRKYGDLVRSLSTMLNTVKSRVIDFSEFENAYSKHITIANYKLSIVDGFLLSTAYILSTIRSRGMLRRGLESMFDESAKSDAR